MCCSLIEASLEHILQVILKMLGHVDDGFDMFNGDNSSLPFSLRALDFGERNGGLER